MIAAVQAGACSQTYLLVHLVLFLKRGLILVTFMCL